MLMLQNRKGWMVEYLFLQKEGSSNQPQKFRKRKIHTISNFRVIPFDPDGDHCYRIEIKSCKSRRLVRLANCSVTRR